MILKTFNIKPKTEFEDIGKDIQDYLDSKDFNNGFCMVYTHHSTACIRVLEPETLLKQDMSDFMERLAPSTVLYRHDDIEHRDVPPDERRNGFSHLRAMLLNYQEIIPVVEGRLDLGKWQSIFFIDCDFGKENRTYNICLVPQKIME
jgi:secondary thiamine-phosphate synthase enzyme